MLCGFQVDDSQPLPARDCLLDYKSTGWDFTNVRCERYRSKVARYEGGFHENSLQSRKELKMGYLFDELFLRSVP